MAERRKTALGPRRVLVKEDRRAPEWSEADIEIEWPRFQRDRWLDTVIVNAAARREVAAAP